MNLTKTALYKLVLIVAVLAAVLEFFFAHPHYHEWWNTTPGFNLLFGFAGCWLLIFVAKIVMTPLLQRPEDYYVDGGAVDLHLEMAVYPDRCRIDSIVCS